MRTRYDVRKASVCVQREWRRTLEKDLGMEKDLGVGLAVLRATLHTGTI